MVTTEAIEQKETDNTALIEEMLQQAQPAPEPGDFLKERVIHQGDGETPMPIVADSVTSAGHAYVYDTLTGDRSEVNRNMLVLQLRKKRPDGSTAFSTRPPKGVIPVAGSLKCYLHPDGPERQRYAQMGFKACPKANLVTEFDVESHMKARHKREWAAIQADRVRKEREEDRAFQKQMMKALSTNALKAAKAK